MPTLRHRGIKDKILNNAVRRTHECDVHCTVETFMYFEGLSDLNNCDMCQSHLHVPRGKLMQI